MNRLIRLLPLALWTIPAIAQTPQSVLINPSGDQTVNQPNGTTLAASSLNGILNEEMFSGNDVPSRVNSAISACGSNPCHVVIPPYAQPGYGWIVPTPTNVVIDDRRMFNGTGFANNGVPDFHFAVQYLAYQGPDQAWETKSGSLGSGPFVMDLESHSYDGGTAHDGRPSNAGALIIQADRTAGSRPIWGEDVNVQYSNLNNVVNGLEIDLVNNSGVDDPGDGTAGNGLQVVASTATHNRSGVGILLGADVSQGASWQIGIGLNAYATTGIHLASSLTKTEDIGISVPDADPTKRSIYVTSSSPDNAQFKVFDDGHVTATSVCPANGINSTIVIGACSLTFTCGILTGRSGC